mmetsp:Transcript_26273/g.46980  ORF Transcript_26273/g.46980 Transcript_26273/m.46980 type:complete len:248 (-) Transcript_26273:4152-4895(-)
MLCKLKSIDFFHMLMILASFAFIVFAWDDFNCFPYPNYWLLAVTLLFGISQVFIIVYKCFNRHVCLKACLAYCKIFIAIPCFVLLTLTGCAELWYWQGAECDTSFEQTCIIGIYTLLAGVQLIRLTTDIKKLCIRYRHLRRRSQPSLRSLLVRRSSADENIANLSFTEPELDRLSSFAYEAESGHDPCSICLEIMITGDSVKMMPSCRHTFHSNCIDGWLLTNPRCPLCKSNVRLALETSLSVNASQ